MTSLGSAGGWRLVDIVVAATVAIAFGAAFLAWNAVWLATVPAFALFWPAQALIYGVWLLPGVLVGLIVRRPGAALFGAFVAAAASVMFGSPWGLDALLSGLLQGLGAEIGFAIFRYRRWNLAPAILAGVLAGVAAALHDVPFYYQGAALPFQLAFGAFTALSGAIVAGVGGWLLLRALVAAGALADFRAGREGTRI